MSAMPTTGITTAIAVFAPVSSPLLPPLLLLEPSFARAAAEDDAAAASAEFFVEVGSSVEAVELGTEVRVTTTVIGLALSAAFVGDWVTTEVTTCVVPPTEDAVLVKITSPVDTALVDLVAVSETTEETDDAIEDETWSFVEVEERVVEIELEMLDVVTVVTAVSAKEELMALRCDELDGTY
jgi:hypothetical protein